LDQSPVKRRLWNLKVFVKRAGAWNIQPVSRLPVNFDDCVDIASGSQQPIFVSINGILQKDPIVLLLTRQLKIGYTDHSYK
jgi:hypothetical protein